MVIKVVEILLFISAVFSLGFCTARRLETLILVLDFVSKYSVTVILLFFLSLLNGSCFLIIKVFFWFQCLELIDFRRSSIVLGD